MIDNTAQFKGQIAPWANQTPSMGVTTTTPATNFPKPAMQFPVGQGMTQQATSSAYNTLQSGSSSGYTPYSYQLNTPAPAKVNPASAYSGGSVVDYLNSTGGNSSYGNRSTLAQQNGISGYTGSADQNTALLNALRNKVSGGSGSQSSIPQSNIQTSGGQMTPEQEIAAGHTFNMYTGQPLIPSSTDTSGNNGFGPSNTPPGVSPYSATSGAQDTLQKYLDKAQQFSDQQNQTQSQLDAITAKDATLRASAGLGVANVQQDPTTDHYMSGATTGILNAAQAKIAANDSTAVPIQAQLARIASQRQAAMDAGKLALQAQTPTFQSYNSQAVNPLTGQPVSGGSTNDAIQAIVQKVQNGNMGYDQGVQALGAYGQMGVNALQKGLGSNFNVNQSNGNAAAGQYNAQTGGTASTDANLGIYKDALAKAADLGNQIGNVDQLGNLLTTTAQQGGINPYDSKFANQSLAQIRSQLSGSAQSNFDSTLQTLSSKIGMLLNAGGGAVTDNVRNSASKVIDGSLSINALPALLQQIKSEGAIVSKNQQDVASKAYQNLKGGSSSSSGSKSGSSLFSF